MVYDLKTQTEKFLIKVANLLEKQATVEIIEKNYKTVKQNRYLHLIITWFAIENGYEIEFVKQEYYKKLSNPEIYVVKRWDKYTETEIDYIRSITDVTKEEMTLSIERFRIWSAKNGTYLPESTEREFLKHIELEAQKHKEFL
jgi:hypothetical protein